MLTRILVSGIQHLSVRRPCLFSVRDITYKTSHSVVRVRILPIKHTHIFTHSEYRQTIARLFSATTLHACHLAHPREHVSTPQPHCA